MYQGTERIMRTVIWKLGQCGQLNRCSLDYLISNTSQCSEEDEDRRAHN